MALFNFKVDTMPSKLEFLIVAFLAKPATERPHEQARADSRLCEGAHITSRRQSASSSLLANLHLLSYACSSMEQSI